MGTASSDDVPTETVRRARRVLLPLAAAAIASAAGVGALLLRSDGPAANPPVDRAAGEGRARSACGLFVQFEAAARSNEPSTRVFELLRAAESAARDALDADPVWVRLVSGLDTIEWALRHDDAGAARAGVDVVRPLCRPFAASP